MVDRPRRSMKLISPFSQERVRRLDWVMGVKTAMPNGNDRPIDANLGEQWQ